MTDGCLLMRRITPFVVVSLLAGLNFIVHGVELSVPLCCGGTQVVTHAAAKFGRQLPSYTSPELVPAYAPRSVYSGTRKNDRKIWGSLFRWVRRNGAVDILALAELCVPIEKTVAEKYVRGKLIFVVRGRCDFAMKALLAEAARAVAVIVVNAHRSDHLVTMKLNETLYSSGMAPRALP